MKKYCYMISGTTIILEILVGLEYKMKDLKCESHKYFHGQIVPNDSQNN